MSQLAVYTHTSGPGSGTVTSVSGGVGINITGVPTVNPTVNLDVPVTIAHGGTNAITFATTDGVVYYDGTRLVTTAVGTSGEVLTSNGVGMAPTYQALPSSSITINGDVGSITGSTLTFTGGSSGAVFTGSMTTMTESFNFLELPNTNAGGTVGYISFNGIPFIHNYGIGNFFLGEQAGNFTLTSGVANVNTAVGYHAMQSLTTGTGNIGIGVLALGSTTDGTSNIAIGSQAMQNSVSDGSNVAIGGFALNALNGADGNTAVGQGAMQNCIASPDNVAIGLGALDDLTIGNGNNVAVGQNTLTNLDSGQDNIALGSESGSDYASTESHNIVIGNDGVVGDNHTIRIGAQGSGTAQQNACYIAGIVGVTTSNSQMVTIDSTNGHLGVATIPSSFTWSVITTDQNAAINNGYICNKAGLLTLTLPTTAVVGSIIRVTGINTALGWKIAQNSGQTIYFGASTTTTGATGSLASAATRDSVEIVCVVANNDWNVLSSIGNLTVV